LHSTLASVLYRFIFIYSIRLLSAILQNPNFDWFDCCFDNLLVFSWTERLAQGAEEEVHQVPFGSH